MKPRSLLHRATLLLMIGSVGFMVCAGLIETGCPEDAAAEVCGSPSSGNGADPENGCDHCLSCQIGHGHVLTLAAERAAAGHSPVLTDRLILPRVSRTSSHARDIEHVPISSL